MGLLVHRATEACTALSAHVLIGRSSACTVRVSEPRASAEHAHLNYRAGVWTLRDLGSRNGTFVNGERLARSAERAISAGDEIVFGGHQATFVLADASAPVAVARRLTDGELFAASCGLLALPPDDKPLVCIIESESGKWTIEAGGTVRRAQDGEAVSVGDFTYVLHLPTPMPPTLQVDERPSVLEDFELSLRVTRDEETVEVSLRGRDGVQVLAPRSHYYTLLTLARLRLRPDAEALAEAQRGWVSSDDLCRMLGIDELKLNVQVFRIRRDMASLGLTNAAQVIERRRGTRLLRLGTSHVSIARFQ